MYRLTTRRLVTVLSIISFFAFCLISALTTAIPPSPGLSTPSRNPTTHHPRVSESVPNSAQRPIRPPSQPPPRQTDDTYGNSSWLADTKALSTEFSKEVTLDDDRALLPGLNVRQPIYCYYDPLENTEAGEDDTDTELLLIWRRAWWARGFKPLILGPDDARRNSLYPELDSMQASPQLKRDLSRWLAWDTMDGGLLSQYTLFPMGTDHDFLPSLRHGEYLALTMAGSLPNALFWGSKEQVHAAVRKAMDPNSFTSATTLLEAVGANTITEQQIPPVLAYYNSTIIAKKYPKLVLDKNKHKLGFLRNQLINAHLQAAWQNSFALGINVIKAFPEHMSVMVRDATDLANALVSCPPTPLAGSCPPNLPKCGPCGATTPLVVRTPQTFMNRTNVFTIGIVPHPWTRTVLSNMKEGINATWIRESERDSWLYTVTQDFLGPGVSRYFRVLKFKKAVAGETADNGALWITAEDPFPAQLDWRFGFAIPKTIADDGKSESPVPSDHINDKDRPDLAYGPKSAELDALEKELVILNRAKDLIALPRSTTETRRRASLEAWNMADTEAWRFTRAMHDRRTQERKHWEQEAKYTESQRVISDAGWTPGMTVTANQRKLDDKKAKARD